MRVDKVALRNFRGYGEFELELHPRFNLLVGDNGTGKTSVLEAIAVAAGSWLLGFRGYDTRQIKLGDVRLVAEKTLEGVRWEQQFPCEIRAKGFVRGQEIEWRRALNAAGGRTTFAEARVIEKIAFEADREVREGASTSLPLVFYYATNRNPKITRRQALLTSADQLKSGISLSRLEAYKRMRRIVPDIVEWFARETWVAFQRQGVCSRTFAASRCAIINALPGVTDVYFDAGYGEIIICYEDEGPQPLSIISDGQRAMFVLVGDLARRCSLLNPLLGEKVLRETTGVVLVDDLEFQIHPELQGVFARNLKETFPSLQFVVTSQTMRHVSGEGSGLVYVL